MALAKSKIAIKKGSLNPLNTQLDPELNIFKGFEVRGLSSSFATKAGFIGPSQNPFQPIDLNLKVSNIKGNHTLLLNKFPVQIGHMLLITNDWQPQRGWLTINDWEAFIEVDKDTSGLWFFNSSPKAGASQPHRHLQLLRRNIGERLCPRDTWFNNLLNGIYEPNTEIYKSISIRKRLNLLNINEAKHLLDIYLDLCVERNIGNPSIDSNPIKPYNLIITKNWMSIITRRKEGTRGFGINALGFAGYFLATNKSDVDWLVKNNPLGLLEEVVDI
tara:strand:+ start:123 stop:944 length:822 start_codon:yes stop_codon:yes gene_type:complete